MKTIVYVDGLNFYYGCTKNTPYKWVNLKTLSEKILGDRNEIIKIKLFAARVKPTASDPTAHTRQDSYFRALQNQIPEIEIQYGHFLEHTVTMPVALNQDSTRVIDVIKKDTKYPFAKHELTLPLAPTQRKVRFLDVIKREEKGSDVNLAVHFLNDALLGNYECGVIISNDSDLAEAVKLVRTQTTKVIGIISPFPTVSKELKQYSHFQRTIRNGALASSQMPPSIPDTQITKPTSW